MDEEKKEREEGNSEEMKISLYRKACRREREKSEYRKPNLSPISLTSSLVRNNNYITLFLYIVVLVLLVL